MDVHDCENIGERSFDYSLVAERAAQSATCLHRATWRLRPGTILSDEPGIYFIPALVDKCEAEGKFRGIVDYDLLRSRYLDFGGIRIEDDLLVTDTGCRILGLTGVGPAAAAAATARAIVDERPDLLLLAGIAGVYPASEVAVGEVVAVAEERVEGLPERYADVYRPTFAVPGLRTAVSNSVARSGAAPAGAEVENMEGAAFFAVAAALGVPAAEVRAVSNRVGEPFGVWRVADACEALARELALLVGEIGSVSSQDRLPLRRSAGGVGKGR